MRILTVRQPWAWAIIHGGKDVENRTTNIAGGYRGPVAIHAGLRYDERTDLGRWPFHAAMGNAIENAGGEVHGGVFTWNLGQPDPRRWLHELGSIIGVVDLAAVHSVDQVGCMAAIPDCSPWADKIPGTHHLVLANPRPLAEPIPYKGALGLRHLAVNDPATTARILAQIGTTA
ncbi:hypothetical protein [Microbacterium resistens]|uniref:hypothetical protein n=1 Tax=Microbacterium resistens TaxID=156977 RepID=UPI001C571EF4|nr:hypothetical protein [Microbacterium resistens]